MSWNFTSSLPYSEDLFQRVWNAIECEIQPATCDIYTYEPPCSDAFSAMGALWNVSYFFFNVKQRKILHFHMREGASDFEPMLDEENDIYSLEEQYSFSIF
ncbi:repressor of RNA polymerase III transcription MAF1 [Histomonas meleagridis]|nr:repressor of RNA polymerase III transcription MAF1 [Histomonas meleagridis]